MILHEWIASGATGPSSNEPTLTKIELYPPAALLAPKSSLRLMVRGTYSNGQLADITNWVRFSSTADLVATVDEDGRVNVLGPGEASITAVFGTQVNAMTVTVPFPGTKPSIPPATTEVDRLINAKLQSLNLGVSLATTDVEFIRRATLDVCGVLPTPEQVSAFVEDPTPDKRRKLIDALLERPEYVDYCRNRRCGRSIVQYGNRSPTISRGTSSHGRYSPRQEVH
jgi:hypothetical protein